MPEIKIEIGQERAITTLVPDSFNPKENTVDVVICTSEPVLRYDYSNGCYFYEVLGFDPANIRSKRLDARLPVLDNHNKYGEIKKGAVLGKLITWAIDAGNRIIGTIKLSAIKSLEEFRQQVEEGTVDFLSAGYTPFRYVVQELATDTKYATYRCIDWEPFEVSFAIVPADVDSSTRAIDSTKEVKRHSVVIEGDEIIINNLTNNIRTMPVTKTPAELEAQERNMAIITAVSKAGLEYSIAERMMGDVSITVDKIKTEVDAEVEKKRKLTPPAPAGTDPIDPSKAAVADAIASERKRASEIQSLVNVAGLDDGIVVAQRMIDSGLSLEAASKEVIRLFSEKDPNAGVTALNSQVTKDVEDATRSRISDAILLNSNAVGITLEPAAMDAAREFRGRPMIDIARQYLSDKGTTVKGLNQREIAERALSTSDFANILGNTVNRSLRAAYLYANQTFSEWSRRVDSKDFRPSKRVKLSGLIGSIDKIPEGGEYGVGEFGDGAETMQIAKYGKMIYITMESMVNDDLGAFARIPQGISNKFVTKQSSLFYSVFLGSGLMSDNLPIFHSTHANLAAVSADITITSLGAARKSFRNVVDEDGEFLNLMPKYLIVGPAKEQAALQLTSSAFIPNTANEVNPYKSLIIIVEPRITGNEWFLAADTGAIDTMEYSFLQGEQEIFTEQKLGWNVDGLGIKARMCFGTACIDWKGLYKNAGA